jgi:hypothetical protein
MQQILVHPRNIRFPDFVLNTLKLSMNTEWYNNEIVSQNIINHLFIGQNDSTHWLRIG